MKRLALIVVIVSCSLFINAQNVITGKWYGFSDNNGFELNFSDDSLYGKEVKSDFAIDSLADLKSIQYIKVIHANDCYYYIGDKNKPDNELEIAVLKIVEAGKRIIAVANYKERFINMDSIDIYIAADTGKKYGINLYNENEFKKMKTFPLIKTMTKEKFKQFLTALLDLKNLCDTLPKQTFKALSLHEYQKVKANNIIIELGYSPYYSDVDMDRLLTKYESDPEFKSLYKALDKKPNHYGNESPDVEIKR